MSDGFKCGADQKTVTPGFMTWKEWCKTWTHHFRPDGTCVCGKKKGKG